MAMLYGLVIMCHMTAELHRMWSEVSKNLPEFITMWEIVDRSGHHQPFGQGIMMVSKWVWDSLVVIKGRDYKLKEKSEVGAKSHREVPNLILPVSYENVSKLMS